jgi:hypothetical protein
VVNATSSGPIVFSKIVTYFKDEYVLPTLEIRPVDTGHCFWPKILMHKNQQTHKPSYLQFIRKSFWVFSFATIILRTKELVSLSKEKNCGSDLPVIFARLLFIYHGTEKFQEINSRFCKVSCKSILIMKIFFILCH